MWRTTVKKHPVRLCCNSKNGHRNGGTVHNSKLVRKQPFSLVSAINVPPSLYQTPSSSMDKRYRASMHMKQPRSLAYFSSISENDAFFHQESHDALITGLNGSEAAARGTSSKAAASHEAGMRSILDALLRLQKNFLYTGLQQVQLPVDTHLQKHKKKNLTRENWSQHLNRLENPQLNTLLANDSSWLDTGATRVPVQENIGEESTQKLQQSHEEKDAPNIFPASSAVPEYDANLEQKDAQDIQREDRPQGRPPADDFRDHHDHNPQISPEQLRRDYRAAIKSKDVKWGNQILQMAGDWSESKPEEMPIDANSILDMYYLAFEQKDPLEAYHLMRAHIWWDKVERKTTADQSLNQYKLLYRHMVKCFEYLDRPGDPRFEFFRAKKALKRFQWDVENHMDRSSQEYILPKLLSSLSVQRNHALGEMSWSVYRYMEQQDFQVLYNPRFLEHLLGLIKFTRRKDLPYAQILSHLIDHNPNYRPRPDAVMMTLEIQYPYTDLIPTHSILCSIVQMLENQRKESNAQDGTEGLSEQNEEPLFDAHCVDIKTLELIGSAAAKEGAHETNLLIWELIGLLNMKPSVGIYEDTAIAFSAAGPEYYGHVFAVLEEMEQAGHTPCRALLSGLAYRFRKTHHTSKKAYEEVIDVMRQGNVKVSISSINAVLGGFSGRGMFHDMIICMDLIGNGTSIESGDEDLVPNQDTYSFFMEGLGKYMATAIKKDDPELKWVRNRIELDVLIPRLMRHADEALNKMEEQGVAPTKHIIRNYIELLCFAGDVETATTIVTQFLEDGRDDLVCSKTLNRLSKAHAEDGNESLARELASHCSDDINYFLHLDRMKEKEAANEDRQKEEEESATSF